MSALLIHNVRLVRPGLDIASRDILVRGGRIVAAGDVPRPGAATATERVDGGGRLLTPGLIDVHTHGVMRSLYENDPAGPDGLRSAARELARFGVTSVLPTIVPRPGPGWLERIAAVAAAIPATTGVHIPGLHLEGPFMAVGGAACPTLPGDLVLLEEMIAACAGRLAVMSVSPDAPGIIPVIRRLREKGVVVFLTHTRANAEDTEAAIEAGAAHATHFYDVFYPPAETDPGVRPVGAVEVILADPRASVDFIADGVHVHPAAIRAAVGSRATLIFDSGVRSGVDVARAIACGADAAFAGKSFLWSLGALGAAGPAHLINVYTDDLRAVMGQTGCQSVEQLRLLARRHPGAWTAADYEAPLASGA